MRKLEIIEELVLTRINGNSITNNKTYTNLLKRVSKADIQEFSYYRDNGKLQSGTKLQMIEELRTAEEYK